MPDNALALFAIPVARWSMFCLCPVRIRALFVSVAILVSILGLPQRSFAQSKPTPPAHKTPAPPPPPPEVDQEQFISYWTTETGWSTELQLRNNAATQNLTVTPALRLSNGVETSLAAVTIKPQEVKSINLDAAIPAGNPQLIGTYGSVVLRYRASTFSGLYAVAMIHGLGHSVAFHIDGTGELQDTEAGSREGIWWLPNTSASDYLVLVNKGQNPLTLALSLFDSSGKAFVQNLKLAPAATTRVSVRQLVTDAGLTGSYGGVAISAVNHAASLNTLHVLFDQNAGFSAIMKMFDRSPNPKLSERDYARTGTWTLRAPMLALSNPDPALAFPFGTVLKPQIFLRNATLKPIDASLRFNWRSGSATGKAAGPQIHLRPYETSLIDVAALQDGTVLPKQANWTSVTITSNALPDELLAVAASYDASLKYGAQTPFSDQLSHQWKGGMWEFDPLHDSIITAGNGGTKPTQAAFTIFYNEGTQKYELDQALQPDEQMWIDIGKLIRESVPDKNGRILPTSLTSGSYEVRDLTNTGIGTLFEGKVIYDKTYGHVTYGCATCCGYNATQLWFDPITLLFGGPTEADGVWGYNVCEQGYDDVSSSFYGDWSSLNTSVITVDQYGTHTGVAVGSTTTETFGDIETTAHYPICPARQFNSSGGGKTMTFTCTPSPVTRGGTVTCAVANAPTGATFSNWKFVDSNNNTVTSTQTSSSWAGTAVTGGTVSVQISASGSNPVTPTASITVNNRSGSNWKFSPASATSENNGFNCPPSGPTLTIPSPPTASFSEDGTVTGDLGMYCNTDGSSFNTSTVNDGGPNNGYKYVTSISQGSSNQPWAYYYVISPDLQNSSSAFSVAQCGNYNAQTNTNGFISQPNLLSNTVRHESGTTASHYAQYSAAVNASANNPGTVAEQQIGAPGLTTTQFVNNVTTAVNSASSNIDLATKTPEPPGPNYDANDTFQGYTNFYPYAVCQ